MVRPLRTHVPTAAPRGFTLSQPPADLEKWEAGEGRARAAASAAAGIAAILVPLPSAIDDHQTANASSLAESGAAWLIPQTELGKTSTVSLLVSLTRDALTDHAGKARSLCIPNATERVADCVTTLARSIGSTDGVRP